MGCQVDWKWQEGKRNQTRKLFECDGWFKSDGLIEVVVEKLGRVNVFEIRFRGRVVGTEWYIRCGAGEEAKVTEWVILNFHLEQVTGWGGDTGRVKKEQVWWEIIAAFWMEHLVGIHVVVVKCSRELQRKAELQWEWRTGEDWKVKWGWRSSSVSLNHIVLI